MSVSFKGRAAVVAGGLLMQSVALGSMGNIGTTYGVLPFDLATAQAVGAQLMVRVHETGGEFAADIVWNSATFGGELAWLMVSAAPTDCISHHGWSRSVVLGIHHA